MEAQVLYRYIKCYYLEIAHCRCAFVIIQYFHVSGFCVNICI